MASSSFFTHDEIWDDSALINVWDEALQEYKVSASAQKFVVTEAACLLNLEFYLLIRRSMYIRSITVLKLPGRIS